MAGSRECLSRIWRWRWWGSKNKSYGSTRWRRVDRQAEADAGTSRHKSVKAKEKESPNVLGDQDDRPVINFDEGPTNSRWTYRELLQLNSSWAWNSAEFPSTYFQFWGSAPYVHSPRVAVLRGSLAPSAHRKADLLPTAPAGSLQGKPIIKIISYLPYIVRHYPPYICLAKLKPPL